ncbi:MAG: TauD/TfdA family dioxygenase, partial [Gammaproteobacteria bacterium]|nr:TauD/TfdA family dioxygenase [Gammaproteobacteria bacterium]
MSDQVMPRGIEHAHAWRAADITTSDWLRELPLDAARELTQFAVAEGTALTAEHRAALPRTCEYIASVQHTLNEGVGFAVLDGVPVESVEEPRVRDYVWTLFSLIGRIVDQKHTGTRIYDVRDTGKKAGYGVRRSITNDAQEFHTDGGWLARPPECIGLFCVHPAWSGGVNRVRSLVQAHNDMLEQTPELLHRLYRDFYWDRQAEHAPDEPKASSQPVFYIDGSGGVQARHYSDYVSKGHALANATLDREGEEALAALVAHMERDEEWIEFTLKSGQFLVMKNRRLAHARTAFEPTPAGEQGRHLYRLWCRDEGAP